MRLRGLFVGSENKKDEGGAPELNPDDSDDYNDGTARLDESKIVEASRYIYTLPQWAWRFAVLHGLLLMAAIIILPIQNKTSGLSNTRRLQTPLTKSVGVWTPVGVVPRYPPSFAAADLVLSNRCSIYSAPNATESAYYVQPVTFSYSSLDSRYLILGCLISTFVFQVLSVTRDDWYEHTFKNGQLQLCPFVERTFSIPMMMMAMCAQMGITDLWTLMCVMMNAWAGMLFSFFAEVMFEHDAGGLRITHHNTVEFHAIAMFGAWATIAITLSTLYSHIGMVDSCFDVTSSQLPANLATAVVYVEMVIICIQLFLQSLSLFFKPMSKRATFGRNFNARIRYTYQLEYTNLILDFLAKFTFCFLLFAHTLIYG